MKERTTPSEAYWRQRCSFTRGSPSCTESGHGRANVTLSPASMSFVFGVILVGPLLGLLLRWVGARLVGAWTVAATMAGALVFGLFNHFLLTGADNVARVSAQWQVLFGITAALLMASEAFGSAVAVRCALLAGRES